MSVFFSFIKAKHIVAVSISNLIVLLALFLSFYTSHHSPNTFVELVLNLSLVLGGGITLATVTRVLVKMYQLRLL